MALLEATQFKKGNDQQFQTTCVERQVVDSLFPSRRLLASKHVSLLSIDEVAEALCFEYQKLQTEKYHLTTRPDIVRTLKNAPKYSSESATDRPPY